MIHFSFSYKYDLFRLLETKQYPFKKTLNIYAQRAHIENHIWLSQEKNLWMYVGQVNWKAYVQCTSKFSRILHSTIR